MIFMNYSCNNTSVSSLNSLSHQTYSERDKIMQSICLFIFAWKQNCQFRYKFLLVRKKSNRFRDRQRYFCRFSAYQPFFYHQPVKSCFWKLLGSNNSAAFFHIFVNILNRHFWNGVVIIFKYFQSEINKKECFIPLYINQK